jgi:hypothetical protein
MPDVRYRTKDGHPSVIRSVEEAIDYIDRQLASELARMPVFKAAKETLQQARERRVRMGTARHAFLTALEASKLLIS